MKTYKIAVHWKVKNGKIQLYGENGKSLPGKGTKYEGSFNCSNNIEGYKK